MKRLAIIFAGVIFAAFTLNAQQQTRTAPGKNPPPKKDPRKEAAQAQNNNPNAPVISFEKTEHDYGTLVQHGDGNSEFKFINEGKEPLILSNVRSSCGCTVPQWPRQPILPGESESIKVKYDTKRIGIINKTVTVYSNAKTPTVVLRIKGKVEAQPKEQVPEKNIRGSGAPVNK